MRTKIEQGRATRYRIIVVIASLVAAAAAVGAAMFALDTAGEWLR